MKWLKIGAIVALSGRHADTVRAAEADGRIPRAARVNARGDRGWSPADLPAIQRALSRPQPEAVSADVGELVK